MKTNNPKPNQISSAGRWFALLVLLLIPSVLVNLSGCKNEMIEPIPDELERIESLLVNNNWRIESVTIDNTNKTSLFAGLTLSFNATSYTTTNGTPVWPASGSWQFADDTGKNINRSDGVNLTVDDISETRLQLTFTWQKTTLGSGKSTSVEGVHTFVFVK